MPNSHEAAATPSKSDNNNSNTKTSNSNTTINKKADKKAADIAYQPARKISNNEKQVIPATAGQLAKTRKQQDNLVYRPLTDRTNIPGNQVSAGGSKTPPGNRYKGKKSNTPPATDALIAANDHANQLNGTDKGQVVTGDQPNTQKSNPPVTTPANTTPPATDSPAIAKKPAPPTDTVAQKAPVQATNNKKSDKAFSIGVTGGVDMSTVKFDYRENAGYNIGLLAGYHFNKNWSVYTGAIYTKKNYKMDGANYTAPVGTPLSYYKLDLVDGYCQMWELPLMGRYTFNSRISTRLFVGAGISSYLMNKEYYTYDYKRMNVPTTAEWTNPNKSQFWFSVLDLSAGIEKPLGHHLVGQLEPYAKLPLKGLGAGKIMLSSFGLNVTLQYRKKLGK
jgi:hypothetical protein